MTAELSPKDAILSWKATGTRDVTSPAEMTMQHFLQREAYMVRMVSMVFRRSGKKGVF